MAGEGTDAMEVQTAAAQDPENETSSGVKRPLEEESENNGKAEGQQGEGATATPAESAGDGTQLGGESGANGDAAGGAPAPRRRERERRKKWDSAPPPGTGMACVCVSVCICTCRYTGTHIRTHADEPLRTLRCNCYAYRETSVGLRNPLLPLTQIAQMLCASFS